MGFRNNKYLDRTDTNDKNEIVDQKTFSDLPGFVDISGKCIEKVISVGITLGLGKSKSLGAFALKRFVAKELTEVYKGFMKADDNITANELYQIVYNKTLSVIEGSFTKTIVKDKMFPNRYEDFAEAHLVNYYLFVAYQLANLTRASCSDMILYFNNDSVREK